MKTNYSIHTMRMLAAFSVICIHHFASYTTFYSYLISGIARFAVPFFLLVTGYFLYHEDYYICLDKFKKQIIRFSKLCITYNLFYFFIMLVYALINNTLIEYMHHLLTPDKILAFFCFNQNFISEPLWYLGAILYATCIFYLLMHIKTQKYYLPLATILLLIHLLLGTYSLYLLGQEVSYIYTRNFLCMALPCLLIGYSIHSHQQVIKKKIHPAFSTILVFLTFLATIIEITIQYFLLQNTNRELYIFTIPFASVLLLYTLYNPTIGKRFLSKAGKRYSFYIYIFHPLLVGPCHYLLTSIHLETLAPFLTSILVFILTLLLAILIHHINHPKAQRNYNY